MKIMQHRFYGESSPFEGDSEVVFGNSSKVGYLSSTQALADYATLIIDLKKNLSANDSPVIVFGGSYGGSIQHYILYPLTLFNNQSFFLLI